MKRHVEFTCLIASGLVLFIYFLNRKEGCNYTWEASFLNPIFRKCCIFFMWFTLTLRVMYSFIHFTPVEWGMRIS